MKSRIGRTDVHITQLGPGGTGLANLYTAIDDSSATRLVSVEQRYPK